MTSSEYRRLAVILGALTAVGPLAIDMYLPALPTIAREFSADVASVQVSLAAYFAGIAIGQAFYGPLSDAIGRKPALSLGLLVFIAASIGIPSSARQGQGGAPADQVSRGSAVYAMSCASCHGQAGAGGRAVALANSRRVQAMPGPEIENVIRSGTPGGMPPFPALGGDDLRAVAAYVASLSPPDSGPRVAGDPAAGEAFFFGRGQCSSCHIVGGRGAAQLEDGGA